MKVIKSSVKKETKKTHHSDVKKLEKNKGQEEFVDKKINPKTKKKEIERELINIYKEPNGEMPDMSKIYHKKRSWARLVLVGLVVFFAFIAALSWAGFFFFGSQKSFSGEGVELEIIAPETAAAGEEIEYIIKYQNNESVPLGQASLEVRLPDHFVVRETTPVSGNENVWQLGSIVVGGKGEIKIKGILLASLDSLHTLQTVLTYKPADFNSEFQKVVSAVTKIDRSLLEVEIFGPEIILAKNEETFKIKYKNTASQSLENLKVQIMIPEGFAIAQSEGEREITEWEVASIAAGDEGEIEFRGLFGETSEGEKEFKAQIGFAKNDSFYLQKENIFKVKVVQGVLLLNLIVNGAGEDRAVNFGDTLNYSIVYQNKGQVDLGDLEIKIALDSTSRNNKTILDWSTLKDDRNGTVSGVQVLPDLRQGIITWTKRQVKELAKLKAGAEGTIDFQIKIKSFSELKEWNVKDFAIKSLATAKISKIGDEVREESMESNAILLKLNSDLSLKTQARYFNDDNIAVGSGPLPPKVGETTAYRIFWKLTNSLHEVENIKVSAVLPENIKWSNKFEIEAGEIKFNEATREVVWTLNRMPLDVGSVGVNFEVTVTPTETDRGKLLTLLLSTAAQATDKSTAGTISKTGDALTSNLDGDPTAEGRGIVK